MLLLNILLIPFKIIIKLIGYTLSFLLKAIGFIICAFVHIFGWITRLLGAVMAFALIGGGVLLYFDVNGMRTENDVNWFFVYLPSVIVTILVILLEPIGEEIGSKIYEWGHSLGIEISYIDILPR